MKLDYEAQTEALRSTIVKALQPMVDQGLLQGAGHLLAADVVMTAILRDGGFGQLTAAYAAANDDDEARYFRALAQGKARDGEIEVDDDAIISPGCDDGAYVMAWLWVDDPRATDTD